MEQPRSESLHYKGHTIWVLAERTDGTEAWTVHVSIQNDTTGAWHASLRDETLYRDLARAFDAGSELGKGFVNRKQKRTGETFPDALPG